MGKGILIVGASRSGTSALTGALGVCGAELGSNHLEVSEHNRKGYCESTEIVELHDRFLQSQHASWDSVGNLPDDWRQGVEAQVARNSIRKIFAREYSGKELWAAKDPRLCRLSPLWQDELGHEDLRVIVPIRHPFEVAHSLARIYGKSWSETLIYWLFNLLEAERNTREIKRVLTTYPQLLSDPAALVNRIETELEIKFPCPIKERTAALKAWVEPDLRRFDLQHPTPPEPGLDSLKEFADSVYRRFLNDDLFTNPARADALFLQCFGPVTQGCITQIQERQQVYAQQLDNLEKEKEALVLRLKSAEAWMKGSWTRRAFHRWNDPLNPRAQVNFWSRLTTSIRKRIEENHSTHGIEKRRPSALPNTPGNHFERGEKRTIQQAPTMIDQAQA